MVSNAHAATGISRLEAYDGRAPGNQGHETAARHNEMAAAFGAAPAANPDRRARHYRSHL
jgi:hypothetical protein